MFKFIYRHKTGKIAVTILAASKDDADAELKKQWDKLAEAGWDIPHPSTFEAVEQIIL